MSVGTTRHGCTEKTVTINHAKVGDAHAVRLPVSIYLGNGPDIARNARPDRQDVVFTAADGVTRLNSEVTVPKPNDVVTENGAWCWYQDPRAVHYVSAHNRTYVGWVNNFGDVVMYQYDEDTHLSARSRCTVL